MASNTPQQAPQAPQAPGSQQDPKVLLAALAVKYGMSKAKEIMAGNVAQQIGGIGANGLTSAVSQTIPSGAAIPNGFSAIGPSPMGQQSIVANPASTGIGSAGNVVLPALGAYGAYNLIRAQGDQPRGNYVRGIGQGAASGAAMGSYFGPMGTAVGGGLGAVVGGIGAMTGSGKDEAQMNRDKLRKILQSGGMIDQKYMMNGADLGLDGGDNSFKNKGKNIDGRDVRHSYDVDFSNPLSGGTIGAINPLTMKLLGEGASRKEIDDMNGMLVNGVMNGAADQAAINKNIEALYGKAGMKAGALPKGAVPSLNAPGMKFDASGNLVDTPVVPQSPVLPNGAKMENNKVAYKR